MELSPIRVQEQTVVSTALDFYGAAILITKTTRRRTEVSYIDEVNENNKTTEIKRTLIPYEYYLEGYSKYGTNARWTEKISPDKIYGIATEGQ